MRIPIAGLQLYAVVPPPHRERGEAGGEEERGQVRRDVCSEWIDFERLRL